MTCYPYFFAMRTEFVFTKMSFLKERTEFVLRKIFLKPIAICKKV